MNTGIALQQEITARLFLFLLVLLASNLFKSCHKRFFNQTVIEGRQKNIFWKCLSFCRLHDDTQAHFESILIFDDFNDTLFHNYLCLLFFLCRQVVLDEAVFLRLFRALHIGYEEVLRKVCFRDAVCLVDSSAWRSLLVELAGVPHHSTKLLL